MSDIMTVQGLDLWYGDHQALHDISMNIPEKSITALIGPSGCGKSTFLKTLNRMNDLIPGVKITGDVRYHDAQRAAELGMHVIDAGHFGTEFPVVATLVSRLREELRGEGEVEVIADRESKDFFSLA